MLTLSYDLKKENILAAVPRALASYSLTDYKDSSITERGVSITLPSDFINILAVEYAKEFDTSGNRHNMIFVKPEVYEVVVGRINISFKFKFLGCKQIQPEVPTTPFIQATQQLNNNEELIGILTDDRSGEPLKSEDELLQLFGSN
jgi:hypothetical protein